MCKWTLQEPQIFKKIGGSGSRSPTRKKLKTDFLLTLLLTKNSKNFSSEEATNLRIIACSTPNKSSDEINYCFFFLSQGNVRFQELIVGKRIQFPHFLLQTSVPNLIPHNIYFYRKSMYFLKFTTVK